MINSAIDIASAPPMDKFMQVLEEYKRDPHFCIPIKVREILEKYKNNSKFILLGSKDFSAALAAAIPGKGIVLHVVDDFKCHKGLQFAGLDIISTDKFLDLAKKDSSIIAINCCRFDYSKRFFDEICRIHEIPHLNHEQAARALDLNSTLDYRLADWGGTILERADEFLALENRLADTYSKESLLRVLTFHLSTDPEWYQNISRPYPTLYFRSGLFNFSNNEKFVDCGASIGESTTALLGTTKGSIGHSWLIEPDKFNIKTLQSLLKKYDGTYLQNKLSLHPYAVGEEISEAPFHHMGGHGGCIAATNDSSLGKVDIRPVDSIIDDIPTFIKMDIEGFELPALKGCTRSIQAGHPKLAISAYHRSTDLLDIPAFIDSISDGYRIGLRHHTDDRWDTCLYFCKD